MTRSQMSDWQDLMGVPQGSEWERFATIDDPCGFQRWLDSIPFFAAGPRRYKDKPVPVPDLNCDRDREVSTQAAFGKILDQLARGDSLFADRIVTMSA